MWRTFVPEEDVNRFFVSMLLVGLALSGAARAADAGICKSMCASEKRECRAKVQSAILTERVALEQMPEKNPLARTAQQRVAGEDIRALDAAGDHHRRMANNGACDDKYLRCTRTCSSMPVASEVK
jgi:hypothetical protein